MALIPKGRYRGMVLVWNKIPVLGKHPIGVTSPPLGPNDFVSYQAYSIIDPSDVPTVTDPLAGGPAAFRYRNFFVPVGYGSLAITTPTWGTQGQDALGLFCSGHTWTSFGDLVVVGGTDFDLGNVSTNPYAPNPPPVGWTPLGYVFTGTRLCYVFNPRHAVATYPGATGPMYSGFQGLWQPGPSLSQYRWYPTATLTHRIQRAPASNRELVMVLGGSRDDNNDPYWDTPAHNPTWNDYEALIVQGESSPNPAVGANLLRDVFAGVSFWSGPGTAIPPLVEQDWFEEYQRCHLLSDGRLFFSGYAPRWATLDPEMHGLWTRAGLQAVTGTSGTWGAYTSSWFDPATPGHVGHPRHDGTSVLFPNIGSSPDVIMRIGGSTEHFYAAGPITTATVETRVNGGAGSWQTAPPMPTTFPPSAARDGGRVLANAVVLPTGGVLVIGGSHYNTTGPAFVMAPQLFENGAWKTLPANPIPSVRDYHSTAVLLEDGRVFLGGGEGRNFDYEILSPPYVTLPRPTNLQWVTIPSFDVFMGADILDYGTQYEMTCDALPVGVALRKAVLTAPCSVTHHSDMHQRYVELKSEVASPNEIHFTLVDNDKRAPRGLYMLWLLTEGGVPSNAKWVVLR